MSFSAASNKEITAFLSSKAPRPQSVSPTILPAKGGYFHWAESSTGTTSKCPKNMAASKLGFFPNTVINTLPSPIIFQFARADNNGYLTRIQSCNCNNCCFELSSMVPSSFPIILKRNDSANRIKPDESS